MIRVLSLLTFVGALVGCKSVAPPTPLADLNAQQMHGHAVYQAHCAQCHYDRKSAALHGPALIGVFKKPYLPSGAPARDDRVTEVILHGRNLMPPAGGSLTEQQLQDLLRYLHTL